MAGETLPFFVGGRGSYRVAEKKIEGIANLLTP